MSRRATFQSIDKRLMKQLGRHTVKHCMRCGECNATIWDKINMPAGPLAKRHVMNVDQELIHGYILELSDVLTQIYAVSAL